MEKITSETCSTEIKKIRFGPVSAPATDLKDMPFPIKRVLHWIPQFRGAENEGPPPVRILISQEILVAVNNHVSQSLETEIGGFLLGNRYRDSGKGLEFVIVDQFVEAPFTEATPVSLPFTLDSWMRLKEDLSGKFSGKALVGWYHSHPRMDVFLSDFDLHFHEERFKEPWRMALVIEPEKRFGGFFIWRDGKISQRNPVEFYEYLCGEAVKTRESVSLWVNYVCYDEVAVARDEDPHYDPPRLQNVIPVTSEPQADTLANAWLKTTTGWLDNLLPKSLQQLAFLLLLAVIIFSSALATYLFINHWSNPNVKPETPAHTNPPTPTPRKASYTILSTIDRNQSKFQWITVTRVVKDKVGRRNVSRKVTELTGRAQILLTAKDVPDGGRKAKQLLSENIATVKVNDHSVNETYTPQVNDLEIQLKVSMPELLNLMEQSQDNLAQNPLNIKMEFFVKDDSTPIEMNGTIRAVDIPKALDGKAINIGINIPQESDASLSGGLGRRSSSTREKPEKSGTGTPTGGGGSNEDPRQIQPQQMPMHPIPTLDGKPPNTKPDNQPPGKKNEKLENSTPGRADPNRSLTPKMDMDSIDKPPVKPEEKAVSDPRSNKRPESRKVENSNGGSGNRPKGKNQNNKPTNRNTGKRDKNGNPLQSMVNGAVKAGKKVIDKVFP